MFVVCRLPLSLPHATCHLPHLVPLSRLVQMQQEMQHKLKCEHVSAAAPSGPDRPLVCGCPVDYSSCLDKRPTLFLSLSLSFSLSLLSHSQCRILIALLVLIWFLTLNLIELKDLQHALQV